MSPTTWEEQPKSPSLLHSIFMLSYSECLDGEEKNPPGTAVLGMLAEAGTVHHKLSDALEVWTKVIKANMKWQPRLIVSPTRQSQNEGSGGIHIPQLKILYLGQGINSRLVPDMYIWCKIQGVWHWLEVERSILGQTQLILQKRLLLWTSKSDLSRWFENTHWSEHCLTQIWLNCLILAPTGKTWVARSQKDFWLYTVLFWLLLFDTFS